MGPQYTVPGVSIAVMGLCLLGGIAIPVGLYWFLRKKYRCAHLPFWVGCGVMFLFALVLERLAHSLVLGSALGEGIMGNVWFYGLYGGFMAGLFEESGRYIAFRTVLKKQWGNDHNALMYGAGHGGFEVIVVFVVTMVNNLVYSILLNTGNAGALTSSLSGESLAALETVFAQLASTQPLLFLLGLVERCAAVAAHMSFSVLVWFAAKDKKRRGLFPLAILLHLVLDAGAVIVNQYVGNTLVLELAVCAFVALCVLLAARVWKTSAKKAPEEEPAQ